MALTSWKAFKFFDVSQVRLPDGEGAIKLDQSSTSSIIAGANQIIVGTPNGTLHLLDQSFKSTRSWRAHGASLTHIKQVPDTGYLVTIAEDLSHEPELKVWNLDQTEKKTGMPKCLCTLHVQNGRKNFPVTAVTVTADMAQVAVGFGNGAVTVVRGDFIHDRGTKQRTVFESEEPITGLEFCEANQTALYIATTSHIRVLIISGSKQGTPARNLDDHGCAVGCMTLEPGSRDIIVARDDAIYMYSLRSKSPAYAYEGAKKLVGVHKDNILVVSPPKSNSFAANALRTFGGAQAEGLLNSSTFTILNPDLKLIAYQDTLNSQVNAIFSIWGDVFLLGIDGKLYRYHERSFQQKLDVIYQRGLYLLAISMARKYNVDKVQQNVIHRKFGDYLYQKGDYDTAMQQYLQAIDNTEPSQIIRKFLDNSHLRNLIDYLEALHEEGKATSDHTTLLLNCYAKLKDVHKLEEFIHQPGELKFDLDTAIVMCRQGGYYEQAAFLARRHEEHGLVVDIMIEDLKWYAEALAYIVRLNPKDAYDNFMKYGTVLLEHEPKDATKLFIDYFTGQYRPKKDAVIVKEAPPETESGGGFGTVAKSAVQNLVSLIPLPGMSVGTAPASEQRATQVVETTTEEYIAYEVPKPRTAFSAFIDHPDQFIEFLEALIGSDDLQSVQKADLYTTLFEIYLHQASSTRAEEKTEWERKARHLIESQTLPIDTSSVLLLSDLEKFRDGTILVSERRGLRADVFRSYTSAHDTPGAIRALHKYGPEEPSLYPAALAYFTSSPQILAEAGAEVESVLQTIEQDGLMAPLQVIQTLSTNAVATMSLVKSYLSKTIAREREEITSNTRQITSYRTDTAAKLTTLTSLSTTPESFTSTRCATCGASLDLPTVHFLCKHSFHQRCLNIADGSELAEIECPICAPQHAMVREVRRAQEESAGRHELFRDALGRSGERFGTVAEWFGRGVMGVNGGVVEG
ncbi:vacuolar protein sorting-associated protein 11 [Teratosphaeria nubilosa]|uniref:E3 ubiquitin-protein ligase PEP5 n=1 Tax=Teratosphaeria nubilosa TaxID=161662 RepID=A0A6G1L3Z5_9PEZI|nr:vacuolar protein sorting-associated protein 11 [Teratosphaeria nubilosa]